MEEEAHLMWEVKVKDREKLERRKKKVEKKEKREERKGKICFGTIVA